MKGAQPSARMKKTGWELVEGMGTSGEGGVVRLNDLGGQMVSTYGPVRGKINK